MFKYELGDILEHRSQAEFGESFLVIGRYAIEYFDSEKPDIWYRVRSAHSHIVDMMEAELRPAKSFEKSLEAKLENTWKNPVKQTE